MKRISTLILGLLLILVFTLPAKAGSLTTNKFIYKPSLGARGDTEKQTFDAGMDRIDARLGKEIWAGDPGIGAALGTPVEYSSALTAALTAIGSAPCTLHIPRGTYTLSGNTTIPANVVLRPERGAIFTDGGGTANLTINGPYEAGLYQTFNWTGSGTVIFGPGTVRAFYSQWWGAKGDGVNNDGPAINQMTASIRASGFGRIVFPSGKYFTTISLNFSRITPNASISTSPGFIVEGDGTGTTMIMGNLSEAYPIMDFTGDTHVVVRDLLVRADYSYGLQTACMLFAREDVTWRGDMPMLERVTCNGKTSGPTVVFHSSDQSCTKDCFFVNATDNQGCVLYSEYASNGVNSKYATVATSTLGNTRHTSYNCTYMTSGDQAWGINSKYGNISLYHPFFTLVGGSTKTGYGVLSEGDGPNTNSGPSYLEISDARVETSQTTYLVKATNGIGRVHITGADAGITNGGYIYLPSPKTIGGGYISIAGRLPGGSFNYVDGGGNLLNCVIYNKTDDTANIATGSAGNTVYQLYTDDAHNWFLNSTGGNMLVTGTGLTALGFTVGSHGTSFKNHFEGQSYVTWSPTTIADGAIATATIVLTIPGNLVNNACPVTVGMNAVPAGVLLSGTVTASDSTTCTVTLTLFNHKGSSYTPGAQSVRVGVWQY